MRQFSLAAISVLLFSPFAFVSPTEAGTCAEKCPPAVVQFVPGQAITIQVRNRTNQSINIEKVQGTKAIPLGAGAEMKFERQGSTIANSSVIWEAEGFPLRAVVTKPDAKTLHIELVAGSYPPGDRAVYIQNDGRVEVL